MGHSPASVSTLHQIAQEQFGYSHLRSGQEAAIQAVLNGKDTLVVMPTGSGKSAIYQIAAYLIPGATVVVSPLVALQRDQVNTLADQDVGEAAMVNSTLPTAARAAAFEQLQQGELEFLFLAPEQFSIPETLEQIQAARPSLFVVDEAHCISAWGHDFRPDYLRLKQVIEALGHPRILALTATASAPVRKEIAERLGMQDVCLVVQGFDRPNIELNVQRFEDEAEKQDALIKQVMQQEKPGIIYVATRKRAEELAQRVQEQGVRSQFYHAGMKTTERKHVEVAFMADEIEVLVATTAFGMGIDKPNIRFVFHADISDSLDSYYQQIGRAGRDNEPATAYLFYNPDDLQLQNFLASSGKVDEAMIKQVIKSLPGRKKAIAPRQLQEQLTLSKSKLQRTLNYLVEIDAANLTPTGDVIRTASLKHLTSLVEEITQSQERRQHLKRSRLEMMRKYAEVHGCRREYLLNYFGEKFTGPCGHCDNCRAGIVAPEPEPSTQQVPFAVDSRVSHAAWGEGTVMRYDEGTVVILFDQVGYKVVDVQTALLRQLLQRVSDPSPPPAVSS